MESLQDSLAFWSSLFGIVLEFLGLSGSYKWLAVIGTLLLAGSVGALLYARRQRQHLKRAGVKIEGRTIDSLNVASLRRRINRTLVIQECHQMATIKGHDAILVWRYAGFCRATREVAVEFSVDTDNYVPFDRLDCQAYDLRHDPQRLHPIRPVLLGADGLSKKLSVPFLEPIAKDEPFSVILTCRFPGCMKSGVDYYTSTVSVDQSQIQTSTVRLVFRDNRPVWVRVYECGSDGDAKLVRDLRPVREKKQFTEYLDIAENRPAQSARIYVFDRPTAAIRPRQSAIRIAA